MQDKESRLQRNLETLGNKESSVKDEAAFEQQSQAERLADQKSSSQSHAR
jgi:hypothetical protein